MEITDSSAAAGARHSENRSKAMDFGKKCMKEVVFLTGPPILAANPPHVDNFFMRERSEPKNFFCHEQITVNHRVKSPVKCT